MDDPEVRQVLAEVPELGFVTVRDGAVVQSARPEANLFSSRWDRWTPTLRYLGDVARARPDFGGEFFVCLYDGWREYAEPVDPRGRRRRAWSALPAADRALPRSTSSKTLLAADTSPAKKRRDATSISLIEFPAAAEGDPPSGSGGFGRRRSATLASRMTARLRTTTMVILSLRYRGS